MLYWSYACYCILLSLPRLHVSLGSDLFKTSLTFTLRSIPLMNEKDQERNTENHELDSKERRDRKRKRSKSDKGVNVQVNSGCGNAEGSFQGIDNAGRASKKPSGDIVFQGGKDSLSLPCIFLPPPAPPLHHPKSSLPLFPQSSSRTLLSVSPLFVDGLKRE